MEKSERWVDIGSSVFLPWSLGEQRKKEKKLMVSGPRTGGGLSVELPSSCLTSASCQKRVLVSKHCVSAMLLSECAL